MIIHGILSGSVKIRQLLAGSLFDSTFNGKFSFLAANLDFLSIKGNVLIEQDMINYF